MTWRRNKYNNVRTGGYDSRLEANDAMWLEQLVKDGVIQNLEKQVTYPFIINGKRLKHYARVDFKFERNGKTVWYETKGFQTDMWRLKKEIIEATLPDNELYLVNANVNDVLAIE